MAYNEFGDDVKPINQTVRSTWRPWFAIAYILICLHDFVIAEYIHMAFFDTDWVPQTLEGGGIFHIASGTILGAASYTRGREKYLRGNRMGDGMTPRSTTKGNIRRPNI